MGRRAKPTKVKAKAKRPLGRDLEKRLAESLERETATSEILGLIGASPMDAQPVFDGIARSGVRVCGAQSLTLFVVDGDTVRVAATHGVPAERVERFRTQFPVPLSAENHVAQVLRERRIFHLVDIEHNPAATPQHIENARLGGYRTRLMIPLLRGDSVLGLIAVTHQSPTPFPDQQVALLKTFADQAVIAIENVRLFTELQEKNRALTQAHADLSEALKQQTATGEILRVISSSPTDVQPVFDVIVERAVRLCGARFGRVYRYDGDMIHMVAGYGLGAAGLGVVHRVFPRPASVDTIVGRVILTREPALIPDIEREAGVPALSRRMIEALETRSQVTIPMLRAGETIGAMTIGWAEPDAFDEQQIALLQGFAAQAVIAIENVRLFRELEQKSRELEVASQHKSEFLANMSHELRTPLNAILGFSEVLTERMFGELNAKQDEYLRDIHASGQHLLSLINDILDLSKIEAGRMELEPADFDLPGAIDNALIFMRERVSRRGIALGREIDDRVGVIRADERKVKQVLLNLLSNALKFTPEEGRIDVRATVNEGMVEVSVADTGVGIAPEDLEAVFEEFRQVGTADKKVEGTGLGLALSRKFIELHGGRIWVKSQVGTGSTFTFTIPARREASDQGGASTPIS